MSLKWPKGKKAQKAMLRYVLKRIENVPPEREAAGVRFALAHAFYAGWISQAKAVEALMLAGKGGMPPCDPPSNVLLAAALLLYPPKARGWHIGDGTSQAAIWGHSRDLPGCFEGVQPLHYRIVKRGGRRYRVRVRVREPNRIFPLTARPATGNGRTPALSFAAACFRARLGDG